MTVFMLGMVALSIMLVVGVFLATTGYARHRHAPPRPRIVHSDIKKESR